MSFVTHLECSYTGERYEAGKPHGLSSAGKPILVRYDLDAIKGAVTKEDMAKRTDGFWRYHEFLPVENPQNRISLGEVVTPLVRLTHTEERLGVSGQIIVKDEGRLPTGSFKARGLALAVSMAKEFGIEHLAMPTAGNAGAAMAAYAARAKIKATVFCPEDTQQVNVEETAVQGGDVYRVNGLINDCGKIVGDGKEAVGWFDLSTLKEPYRIEGKKTMGIELAEQLGWEVPDAIFYPTGGGTGLIGMWKAFNELEAIGWIGSKRPKMIAVQAAGCAPIVKAWENGEEHAPLWENAFTEASGLRVPIAVGDFLIIRAVNESNGFAVAIEEGDIFQTRDDVAQEEGLLLCPEGAATFAAYRQSLENGRIAKSDRVVLFNCATGLKYPMPAVDKSIDRSKPVDYSQF